MSSFLFFVGSYTNYGSLAHTACGKQEGDGIYVFRFSDGKLKPISVIPADNPAVLIPHPSNNQKIYSISETIHENGRVDQIAIDICPQSGNVSVNKLEEFVANGYSTCYLSFSRDQKTGILVSYWDSIIDVVQVGSDESLSRTKQTFQQVSNRQWRQVTDKFDHWQNRMVGPHAHSAHFWHDWVFIPDLGENAIFQYRFDQGSLVEEAIIPLPEGCGPRHMCFHPSLNIAYVSNELNSTVSAVRLDGSDPSVVKPRISIFQTEATIQDEDQVNYVAEVALSPDGKFLYVSNRGDDSIAIFAVDEISGSLSRISVCATGGKTPRHFAISPCGSYVIVANQDSCDVSVFQRCFETGVLTESLEHHPVPSPNFVLCVPCPE